MIRLHGHPLGIAELELPAEGLDPEPLAASIWAGFGEGIAAHLARDGKPMPDGLPVAGLGEAGGEACSWRARLAGRPLPAVTVGISTCGGRHHLVRTVATALEQDYPNFEVAVIDNRPASSGVEDLLAWRFPAERRLRYVPEPRAGLGRARNAGLRATEAPFVAFTDDDVVLDRSWLGWLVAGFTLGDDVACVTGLILPAELDTPAQLWLEEFGGFSKGFEARVWDRDRHRLDHPLYPYTVGLFGSGANAAFRRQALLEMGGFDDRLGAGTPARGGEDLDIYTRVVLRGQRLVYQPAALLRHSHNRELGGLERQVWLYGVGLTAMLTKHLFSRETRGALVRRLPAGLVYAFSPRSAKHAGKSQAYPIRLTLLEFAGMACGPFAYLRSRLSP